MSLVCLLLLPYAAVSSQKDFKDLVEGGNRSKAESDAWRKFRSERGETEMVRSFARRLVKKWN